MPYYFSRNQAGITQASAQNDGATILLKWSTAYPETKTNAIAYNIYYSSDKDSVFSEGAKYVVTSGTEAYIPDLTPGDMYYFAVRAVEYTASMIDVASIPIYATNLRAYPTTMLSDAIDADDITIPLVDTSMFPTTGILVIGVEAIRYSANNTSTNTIGLLNSLYRGYLGTEARLHNTDGYDGVDTHSIDVKLILGTEEQNTKFFEAQCRFDIDHFAYTETDGYHQRLKDHLTVDLGSSDIYNETFPSYDYAGWHRTDPVQLLNGDCVGSYIGGEQYCADGYSGVGRVLRGMSVQTQNNQRQEMLLSVTGEPVVFVRKRRTGITCSCYTPAIESPEDRCPKCLGTGFVGGWEQYYNPRRSDSRIMVKFGPADDKVKITESGFESEAIFDCWTLTVPTVKDRDFIVRFDQDGNEEFRYEILTVTRNRMLESLMGGQKFRVQRVRKTDPIYQVRLFRNTALIPAKLNTSISSVPGILPHSHVIVVNENTTTLQDINQMTSVTGGHSHDIIDGVVQEALGHTHLIVLP